MSVSAQAHHFGQSLSSTAGSAPVVPAAALMPRVDLARRRDIIEPTNVQRSGDGSALEEDDTAHDDERDAALKLRQSTSLLNDLTASTSSTDTAAAADAAAAAAAAAAVATTTVAASDTAADPFGDLQRAAAAMQQQAMSPVATAHTQPVMRTVAPADAAASSSRSAAALAPFSRASFAATNHSSSVLDSSLTQSRRTLVNVLAYWLSLQCEQQRQRRAARLKRAHASSLTQTTAGPVSGIGYRPAYFDDPMTVRHRLEDIYWSTGATAEHPQRALLALAAVQADAPPAQIQRALVDFVNAIGAEPLARYMRQQPSWPALSKRYALVLGNAAASPAQIIKQMSEEPMV